jgi:protein-disulfide isomerase
LDYHSNALPLARASECAAKQGKFEAFYDLVYARQRAMLSLSVTAVADSVGVPDIRSFEKCFADTTQTAAVDRDIKMAGRVGASGTPAILAGGMLIRQIVDSAFLEGLLRK